MDTEHLKTLALVAKYKNFTKVSELIGKTPGGVRHQMDTLEKHLKIKLYQGFPSGIQLTEEGEEFAQHAATICTHLDENITSLRSYRDKEEGELKLVVSSFGFNWISHQALEFENKHPNIYLRVVGDQRRSILFASALSGVFAGLVALKPPNDATFVWHSLGTFLWYPFAHPKYLAKYGTPKTLSDLDHHRFIRYDWSVEDRHLEDKQSNLILYVGRENKNPRQTLLTTDNTVCSKELVQEGYCIGLLPKLMTIGSELIQVLNGIYPAEHGLRQKLYLVYPPYLKDNKRIELLKKFILERLEIEKILE